MERPLRVLHVVVNMNRGGAETLIMNLYRHIDRSMVQFDFLTCMEGVFDDEVESLGGRIYRIPYINEVGHQGYRLALRQFFDTHKDFLIVHAHMDRMSGLVLSAAHNAGVPVRVAHSHNTRSEGNLVARIYKWYAGLYIRRSATHRFACSKAAANWLFSGRRSDVELLKNGIDPECFAYSEAIREVVRSGLGIKQNTLVLGHVGRFNHQKNHAQLLTIFQGIVEIRPNSMLLLAGDGPLRQEMEQRAVRLGIAEKVIFLGIRADVENLLQAFDVFVFPSHHEGLPVTLVEAQCSGLPCLVSDAVSSEADLGFGLAKFISNQSTTEYVKQIAKIEVHGSIRSAASGMLASQGYDIRETARWIQNYYYAQCEVEHEDVNRIYANV